MKRSTLIGISSILSVVFGAACDAADGGDALSPPVEADPGEGERGAEGTAARTTAPSSGVEISWAMGKGDVVDALRPLPDVARLSPEPPTDSFGERPEIKDAHDPP